MKSLLIFAEITCFWLNLQNRFTNEKAKYIMTINRRV